MKLKYKDITEKNIGASFNVQLTIKRLVLEITIH